MPGFLTRVDLAARALVGLFSESSSRAAFGMLPGILPGGVGTPPTRDTLGFLQAYSQMPWLRACVGRIAEATASTRWRLYAAKDRRTGKYVYDPSLARAPHHVRKSVLVERLDEGSVTEIVSHPFLDALDTANEFLSGYTLRKVTQVYMELVGDSFWLKERNGTGMPVAFWPLPPSWILSTPTPARRTYRVSYRAWQGEIPDTEIFWQSEADPVNPYGRGSGIAPALRDELETDEFAARTTKHWFFNRAKPDLIITADGLMPEETKAMEVAWMAKVQGFLRFAKPMFLGKKVEITELDQNFRAQQLIQLRQHERDIVVQTWGVPPEAFGILENSNRATIDAAYYLLGKLVITPRLEFTRTTMQERLVPEYDRRLILDYDSPVDEDRQHQLEVAKAAPWAMDVDEWREMMGQKPYGDARGKVHMVSTLVTPMTSFEEPKPAPVPGAPAPNGGPPVPAGRRVRDASLATIFRAAGPVEQIAERMEPQVRARFLDAVARLRGRLDVDAMATLLEHGHDPLSGVDLRHLDADLQRLVPILQDAYEAAGIAAADDLTARGLEIGFNAALPRAAAWARTYGASLVRDVSDSVRESIRQIIGRAIDDGLPPRTSAQLIQDVVGLTNRQTETLADFRAELVDAGVADGVVERRVSRYASSLLKDRAENIARTETLAAENNGQQELWRQAADEGLITRDVRRVWLVTDDDRLDRKVCEPMDEQERGLEEEFVTGKGDKVLVPPAHPRCRCALALKMPQ